MARKSKIKSDIWTFFWYLDFFLADFKAQFDLTKKSPDITKKTRYHSIYPDFFLGKIPSDRQPWKSKRRWNWVSVISFSDKIEKIEIQARCTSVFLSEFDENIETHFCVLRSRYTRHFLKKLAFKISTNLIQKNKSGVYHAELCETDLEEVV